MDGISIMTVTPVLASSCVENISHQVKGELTVENL